MKAAYFPRRLFLKKKTNISKYPKRYGKNVRQHHRRLEMASEHTRRRQTPLRGCHRQVCGNRHSMLHNLRKHFLTHTHIHHGQRTNPPMPLQVVLALEDRHKTRPLQQGRDALPSIGIPRPQMAVLGERNATRRGSYDIYAYAFQYLDTLLQSQYAPDRSRIAAIDATTDYIRATLLQPPLTPTSKCPTASPLQSSV